MKHTNGRKGTPDRAQTEAEALPIRADTKKVAEEAESILNDAELDRVSGGIDMPELPDEIIIVPEEFLKWTKH